MSNLFILKVPSKIDSSFEMYTVDEFEYTSCKESQSMYDGSYPMTAEIVCYWSEEIKKEVVVPYRYGTPDRQYGFHKFKSIIDLLSYVGMHEELLNNFKEKYPEYLI